MFCLFAVVCGLRVYNNDPFRVLFECLMLFNLCDCVFVDWWGCNCLWFGHFCVLRFRLLISFVVFCYA